MLRSTRINKELEKFQKLPPPGIQCWPGDDISELKASILGPDDTPYENGVFYVNIQIPERYPFVPPKLQFTTPVYHPNIDNAGRICLDVLKMPPSGSWKPSLNLASVLTLVQLLMKEPNFNDPLMAEIAEEYRSNRERYILHAKEWTAKHAKADPCSNLQMNCLAMKENEGSLLNVTAPPIPLPEAKRRRLL